MSDPTDAALDSWINWLEDLPLPKDFDEGVTGLQGFITALRTERAKDHAEINLKADFIEATLNQLAASEETIENLRAERDDAFARGVRAAKAAALAGIAKYMTEEYDTPAEVYIEDAIRALASAPPAPVVRVKPLVWEELENIEEQLQVNESYFDGQHRVTLEILQGHIKDSVSRIRAALLPQAKGGDA